MTSNQSATKKVRYLTPERCLLRQAALWFEDGVEPIPDEAFLLAPKHFSSKQPDFSELFRALKVGRCNLRGDLVLDFAPDRHSLILVQNHAYPRFQHQGYEFNLEGSDLEDVDFAGSSIKYQSDLILEVGVRNHLNAFKRERLASGSWRERTCFIQNVSVKFGELIAIFSDREIGKSQPTAAAEGKCQKWLLGLMRTGGKNKSKAKYFAEAKDEYAVSRRGFNRAWANAVSESGNPGWSKPGRKS